MIFVRNVLGKTASMTRLIRFFELTKNKIEHAGVPRQAPHQQRSLVHRRENETLLALTLIRHMVCFRAAGAQLLPGSPCWCFLGQPPLVFQGGLQKQVVWEREPTAILGAVPVVLSRLNFHHVNPMEQREEAVVCLCLCLSLSACSSLLEANSHGHILTPLTPVLTHTNTSPTTPLPQPGIRLSDSYSQHFSLLTSSLSSRIDKLVSRRYFQPRMVFFSRKTAA